MMKVFLMLFVVTASIASAQNGAVSSGGSDYPPFFKSRIEMSAIMEDADVVREIGITSYIQSIERLTGDSLSPIYEVTSSRGCTVGVELVYSNPRLDVVEVKSVGPCL